MTVIDRACLQMLTNNGPTAPNVQQTIPQGPLVGTFITNDDLNSSSTASNVLQKDSQWLTLEICREHLRNKCQRSDSECKFAHPPKFYPLEIHHGRVICCYDYIKGKCNRKSPPCKYLHPPLHLKEQLLQNGRNNLIVKNIQYNLIRKQIQTNPYYAPMAPLQINVSNLYQSIPQSTIFPSAQLANNTSLLQCLLPMSVMSPYPGEIQYSYNIMKDNLLTSKPSSLVTNHGIIPGVLIQPIVQSISATSTTDNYRPLFTNPLSPNNFIN